MAERPPTDRPTADDVATARRELLDLREHWSEREAALDQRSAGEIHLDQRGLLRDAARRFARNRLAMASVAVLAVMVVFAVLVPWLNHTDLSNHEFALANAGPSLHHPFGADVYGIDLFKQAWSGARISLSVGFGVALTVLVIGLVYGSVAGYAGGRVDAAMMRLLDALYGLPALPFAIIFVQIVQQRVHGAPPLLYMVPALSITSWFTAARIVRNQVLSLKQEPFVEAARAEGASGVRITSRHLVPNVVGVLVVSIFLEVPGAILGEAVLSLLGLGVQPPALSWGNMASIGRAYVGIHPAQLLVAGTFIAVTIIASTAIADGLRDALDPRADRG